MLCVQFLINDTDCSVGVEQLNTSCDETLFLFLAQSSVFINRFRAPTRAPLRLAPNSIASRHELPRRTAASSRRAAPSSGVCRRQFQRATAESSGSRPKLRPVVPRVLASDPSCQQRNCRCGSPFAALSPTFAAGRKRNKRSERLVP